MGNTMHVFFMILLVLPFSALAQVQCQNNPDLKEIHALSKEIQSICPSPELELLKIDLDIGLEGGIIAAMDENGKIKSLQLKYDSEDVQAVSVEDFNKGKKLEVAYPSQKNPMEITVKKGTTFDPEKGGEINLKIMLSPTPRNMLTGTRIMFYKNYPVSIVKVDGQWKVLRKKSPISSIIMKAKSTWTWDGAYQSIKFK